jgi:hypothetical protein
MEIFDMDDEEDEFLKKIESIPRWHCLRKITLEGDYPDDK